MVAKAETPRRGVQRRRHPEAEPEFAELTLGPLDELGDTTAEFEGRSINVAGGIPGERVIVRIHRYRRRRKERVSGIVTQVIEPSPARVRPRCGYSGMCSGCQWQHVDYTTQLTFKRERIERYLEQYASLAGVRVKETLPAPKTFYYRNHARFTVRRGGQLGFSNRITRRFVRIEHCMLMDPLINRTLVEFQDRAGETTNMSIRVGANTGDVLVQPTFQNPEIGVPSGQTHFVERMGNRDLRVASPSFFQVNTAQAENLVELVRSGLHLQPDDVLVDAYAGVGVIAILLAPYVRRAIAIEESAAAVKDGAANAECIDNVEFIQQRTEDALADLIALCDLDGPPDSVVLDPPRVGCHPQALDSLVSLRPEKVAYVSCDPQSLARDLDILVQGGYEVVEVQPVDMFPQTYHIESVTIMRRRYKR